MWWQNYNHRPRNYLNECDKIITCIMLAFLAGIIYGDIATIYGDIMFYMVI